ncbi:MAG: gamma-glutamyltransferase family protein [Betaproteobacteria bacterium]|nr:gamma-glutamyltransferase family protein [Betaproteobacteria bacterium]
MWAICPCPAMAPSDPALQPEAATGLTVQNGVRFARQGVSAAHPLASQAGLDILRQGGSALDAAIAVQMVLSLVEPQSSGIGGGAFLLYHDGQSVRAYDGRETAPALASENQFMREGRPMDLRQAVHSGLSVGVPGVLRMLELAHKNHGRLPWARLFEPAIALAQTGFPMGARLHQLLRQANPLQQDPHARAYFYQPDGQPWPVGHRLQNPGLAEVLGRVARAGAQAFYEGEIAQAMVNKVQQHPDLPGLLSLDDLRSYQALPREPLCFDHPAMAELHQICGFPPPSSGAVAMAQIFGLLAKALPHTAAGKTQLQREARGWTWDEAWWHTYAEAARLAYADRAMYLGDPDFVTPPAGDWRSLIAPAYLGQRAQLIGPQRMPQARAGQPNAQPLAWSPMPEQTERGTSHLSITDRWGHTLAMTTSIESAFGSHLLISLGQPGGFLLNNQLTDFSFVPRNELGLPVANRVEPRKRPRSSMSPTLVLRRASPQAMPEVHISLGSPGGAAIIHYTSLSLWAMLHAGLLPQSAFDLPHLAVLAPDGVLWMERERFSASTAAALAQRGHSLRPTDLTSGLHGLRRIDGAWWGGADARREGAVQGD